jgi:hypothetical protein
VVQSQPGQIASKTLSQKHPSQKRAGGMAQGAGLEFKTQCQKKKLCLKCNLETLYMPHKNKNSLNFAQTQNMSLKNIHAL